jgi:NADH-quinone oxidoreductase subunit M
MKKLIAYSSISHMGFVTLGFFIIFAIMDNKAGGSGSAAAVSTALASGGGNIKGAVTPMLGGMVQMISHGFISAALFLCVGVLYDRVHSREIGAYGGVVNRMPMFAAFAVLFAMANAGLPGTSGFVGEFLVILASFGANVFYAVAAATTLIIGAAYTLWMVKRVYFGEVANDNVESLHDLGVREFIVLALLAVAVLFFGIWPDAMTSVMHDTLEKLVTHVALTRG